MKRNVRLIGLFLTAAIFAMSLMALSGCEAAGSEQVELTLAHFFSAAHPAETVLVEGWAEALSEATNGRVSIESYPGGTLLDAADIYNGVVTGVADIGLSCFAYTPGRFPVLEAFELPGITYLNSQSASMVAWEGIQTLNPPEVQDTHLLMVLATGPGDIFSRSPIRSLEDLQGMEIRATGISTDTLTALGGVPVGMPQPETYDSLQRGVVQGNLSPIEVLQGWNHAEVTSYITMTPFLYNTLFFVTMNLDVWNGLSEELQQTITEVTEQFHKETAASLWDMQNESALIYAVEEHGLEVINLPEDEAARWIEKVQPIQDDYNQKLADLGIDEDPLTLIHELADKYNAMAD